MSLNRRNILDDLDIDTNPNYVKLGVIALMYSLSILLFYFLRDYYFLLNPLDISEKKSVILKGFCFIILVVVCFTLSNQIYAVNLTNGKLHDYQLSLIVFSVFLLARLFFYIIAHVFLGLKIIYPKTMINYSQGLMIAGFMGVIAYNRIRRIGGKKIYFSLIGLLFYYLVMQFINSQFSSI